MTTPAIVWFRQDLRLSDHLALTNAAADGRPVIPVYILDDETPGDWAMGAASRWWLHGSLEKLALELKRSGSRLILRRGHSLAQLEALVSETGARDIFFTRAYEPAAARLEVAVHRAMKARGVTVHRYRGGLMLEPEDVANKSGEPFRVFTPFGRVVLQAFVAEPPLPRPALTKPDAWPKSDTLASWALRPTNPDWATGIKGSWQPGEMAAQERLTAFIDGAMMRYDDNRNRPDIAGTSRLSPHLHFGEISPNQCFYAVERAVEAKSAKLQTGADAFLREIVWREFSTHLLHHFPALPDEPFRPEFRRFLWRDDKALLRAWQKGQTGYPIVDAGMRELWQTGWMHNRVRMITASFLIKHLLQPWQAGERWFWDCLVDADLANNAASWQWVAGSGADAAPYFRIFNPVLQGQKFDPEGVYVRRFVPELAGLDTAYIHAPWTAPDSALAKAGIRIGETYPEPIVAHDLARKAALDAFAEIRRDAG